MSKTKINITIGVLTGLLVGFVFGAAFGTPDGNFKANSGNLSGNVTSISPFNRQARENISETDVKNTFPSDTIKYDAFNRNGEPVVITIVKK